MQPFHVAIILIVCTQLAPAASLSIDTDCHALGNCIRNQHQNFDALLDSTLMTYGLHRANITARGKHGELPVPENLYLAGAGARASKLKKAKKMKKVSDKNAWQIMTKLYSGGLVFLPSKDTWKGGFGAKQDSVEREEGFCTFCGLHANMSLTEDEGAVDVPGPTKGGLFNIVVDFDAGTISYTCSKNCWPHKAKLLKAKELWAVGRSICGDGYKTASGTKLEKQDDPNFVIFKAKLHLCPGSGFKIYPKKKSLKEDVGLWEASYVPDLSASEDHLALDGHGRLRQFQDGRIPGPDVESYFELTVDLTTGTFKLHCVEMCNGPKMTDYERFQPENAPNSSADAFVHLFSWRWNDIANECETFLGPKGVKGVQIAPPQESKLPPRPERDSWNYVYRPVSYRLDSRLGTEAELKDMIDRCNAEGVDVYFDAVINQMTGGRGVGSGGSSYGSRSFPAVGYEPVDFHHTDGDLTTNCRVDYKFDPKKSSSSEDSGYDDETKMKCDFNGMPDLDTSSPKVQGKIRDYLNKVLDMGAAGFRVDAADHIGEHDLKEIMNGVVPKYRFQETHHWQDKLPTGAVVMFSYRSQVLKAVLGSDIHALRILGEATGLAPSQDAVVMINNHDISMKEDALGMGIIYKQTQPYTLANIIMLALPYGYPKVMSSYYFPDHGLNTPPPVENVHGPNGELRCGDGKNWVCEHRWPGIANMFRWRKAAGSHDITEWKLGDDPAHAYFCRGSEACILLNSGNKPWTIQPTDLSLSAGTYCNIIESDEPSECPTVTILESGISAAEIVVPELSAVALHARALGAEA